jgi:ABC-2 type transport system ATP-binding protein
VSTIPVISIDCLAIRYGRTTAVDDATLSLASGAVFGLLGRNGAGKSSIVRCLLGLQKPSGGTIRVHGLDPWRERAQLMLRVGYVPEDPVAPLAQNALQLEKFSSSVYPRWNGAEVRARFERFGIPLSTPYGKLSKGERRAVSLALALGHGPDLLILDDPTLGLDAVARRLLFDEMIGELAERGTTVLVTTHDMAGIEALADRVAILHEGRLVLDESTDELRRRFRKIRTRSAPAGKSELDEMEILTCHARAWGSEFAVANYSDILFDRLREARGAEAAAMSLEEVFIAVTQRKGELR